MPVLKKEAAERIRKEKEREEEKKQERADKDTLETEEVAEEGCDDGKKAKQEGPNENAIVIEKAKTGRWVLSLLPNPTLQYSHGMPCIHMFLQHAANLLSFNISSQSSPRQIEVRHVL